MKILKTVLCSIFLFMMMSSFAQKNYTAEDFFTEKNIVWYGIDFSNCKFIGQPAIHGKFYKDPDYVVKNYFRDWNTIPIEEADKYNIKGTFEKEYVYYDVDTVMAHNKKFSPDSLISITGSYHLNPVLIPQMINGYGGVAKEGIGVVYIVESFDHEKEIASYYVVVFDIASKKILMKDHTTGKPGGATLKTYWAHSFREALDNSHKIYKKWRKWTMVKN
jgi:hypothetical protein